MSHPGSSDRYTWNSARNSCPSALVGVPPSAHQTLAAGVAQAPGIKRPTKVNAAKETSLLASESLIFQASLLVLTTET